MRHLSVSTLVKSKHYFFYTSRPSTKKNLLRLEDFPEAKVEKFGDVFLDIIRTFCATHKLELDDFPELELSLVSV